MNSAHFLTPLTTQERKRTKIQPQKQSLCPLNAVSQRRVARSVKNYLHPLTFQIKSSPYIKH